MAQRNFKENDLFKGGIDWPLNACVGDNGGPYGLFDYAQGYLECSRLIIEAAKNPNSLVDTLVYPACYNFRHGIELYIKYGIESLAAINRDGTKYRTNHSLKQNWQDFRDGAENIIEMSAKDLSFIQQTIDCFDEVDPNGQIFRYPESIKGIQHLREWSLINLGRVGAALEIVTGIFKEWHYELCGVIDAQNEAAEFDQDERPME
jgi:hypothetical protein